MKQISKLVLLVSAAVVGLFALMLGNNPFGTEESPNNVPVTIMEEERVMEDDLGENTLNFIPTQVLGDKMIEHRYYTLSYSSYHQNAEWVAYELRGARLNLPNEQKRQGFKSDPNIEREANSSFYENTGYDRGHLAPAHDMSFNEVAMRESFYMTNISPQVPDFNRGIWKSLENKVRKWATKAKRLFIVTGPLLRKTIDVSERLVAGGPSIPVAYYKIILDYDSPTKKGIAFMFKNKSIDQPVGNFVTTIDRVEAYTGLDFFPELSLEEQKALEAVSNPDLWESL